MTDFVLCIEYQIRGDQLIHEIRQATDINLTDRYTFYSPSTVSVPAEYVAGHEAEIQAVVDAHVPDPLYFPADLVRQVEIGANTQAASIPGWASWTIEQAGDWHKTNVSDRLPVSSPAEANELLAAMDTELKAMGRMLIAARNKLWPNLKGGE